MKLFVGAMIRDELDVLPSWLRHVGALFDRGCLVDHLSGEGAQALLQTFAQRPGWSYRRLDSPAYLQAEQSNELLMRAFAEGADAVFVLDADEFIGELDRADLERAVAGLGAARQLGHLRWRNCLPAEYHDGFRLDQRAWLCGLSVHKKIVLPRWVYERWPGQVRVNQGNHTAIVPEPADAQVIAELYHFPIRSPQQLMHKVVNTYLAQATRPDGVIAPHIRALFETVARRPLTPGLLNALAVDYGAPVPVHTEIESAELAGRGFRLVVPRITVEDR